MLKAFLQKYPRWISSKNYESDQGAFSCLKLFFKNIHHSEVLSFSG